MPQGSILGPLLYLFFINNLPSILTFLACYTPMTSQLFSSVSSPMDCASLQASLDILVHWCTVNKLAHNSKCHSIHYSLKTSLTPFSDSHGGCSLSYLKSILDLGVTFDDKLRFDSHFFDITNRASKMSGFILRFCTDFTWVQPSIMLFNFLKRSILEYCSVICSSFCN